MGPFPRSAPRATISPENLVGTDGFEWVEFVHPAPEKLREVFARMGYTLTARHRRKAVELWQQGDITRVPDAEPRSHAMRFAGEHRPFAPSMAWRVVDARHAFDHAMRQGATPYEAEDRVIDLPAIVGIGGSLISFTDRYGDETPCDPEFDWVAPPGPKGVGFHYPDHLTHNVHTGNMDVWLGFHERLFGFRQIRFFDIEGSHTGLYSRAPTSPCGRIGIPINEDRGQTGQTVEYLRHHKGEGIQHIAVGTGDTHAATDAIAARGLRLVPAPPPACCETSRERVPGHEEPLDRMAQHGILSDGEGVVDGGRTKILLQIFSKTVIGPIFFEFIQRKGDDGFGEGNFRALFHPIEADQLARGVLKPDAG